MSRCLAQLWVALSLLLALIASATTTAQQQEASPSVTPQSASRPVPETTPETSFDVPQVARTALAFTRYALDVKLEAANAAMHVRAIITVKNTSAAPLPAIPLQISSTLAWETIAADGRKVAFAHHTVATDADHTGVMNEAWIALPTPLAPGDTRIITVFYGGTLPPAANRLERIGTPHDIAIHSDWDGIRDDFTGLRGFGNVLWYPTCAPPVALGEGDRLFSEIGEIKQRDSGAIVTMAVTEEFAGEPPGAAFLDGVPVPVREDAEPKGDLPGVVSARLPVTSLGFATPSLFLARRALESGNNLRLYARQDDAAATQAYMTAASILTPQLSDWLGTNPKGQLSVLDLPATDDGPAEERALWLTNIGSVDPKRLEPQMSHVLAHAWFVSPRPWLSEGVAQFMASLWTEHQAGRDAAITQLDNLRGALSLAETADPDHDPGQPLTAAKDPIFYRTKATYVFWMLRGIVGDKPLAAALREYDAAQDTSAAYLQHLLERTANQPLDWFFRDWVDRDRGLPALAIENVTPSRGSGEDSYIVAVTVSNSGAAVADVPVTIYSSDATVTERMRIDGKSRATRRFLVHGAPDQVQANDGTTPETEASVHRRNIVERAPQ